jgi:hypothetical protein
MKFRKKPVVIEAHQIDLKHLETLAAWCGGEVFYDADSTWLEITTLEGVMRADEGDWIIQGVQGEFYPCKPDIFAATYELAEDGAA